MQSNFAEMGGRSEGGRCMSHHFTFVISVNVWRCCCDFTRKHVMQEEFTSIQQKLDFIDFSTFLSLIFRDPFFFIFLSDFARLCLFSLFSLVYFQSISSTLMPSSICCSSCIFFCLLCPYRPDSLPSFLLSFFCSFLPSFLFLPILAYFTVTAGLRL